MSPLYTAFSALMLISCFYAMIAGRRDGRIAVALLVSATLLTWLALGMDHYRFVVGAIDAALLVGLAVLAMRTRHYWPLWLAGMHCAGMAAHIVTQLNPDLPGKLYHAIIAFWSIPMQVILVIGILMDRRAARHAERLAPDGGSAP
jgi:hypothetical protein